MMQTIKILNNIECKQLEITVKKTEEKIPHIQVQKSKKIPKFCVIS